MPPLGDKSLQAILGQKGKNSQGSAGQQSNQETGEETLIPDDYPGRLYQCRRCLRTAALEDDKLDIDGHFEHTFFSGNGQVFRIGCFAESTGCQISGLPEMEDSWFDGMGWQKALCQSCGEQLGWLFSDEENYFWALMLNKLLLVQRV